MKESNLKSVYPQGMFVCPVCGKEFKADDDTRYIISGGYTCSWKCFLNEVKRRQSEKKKEDKEKNNKKCKK